ncbi:hypothetical protein LIER_06993 [Lithospermum erythrorhizon]|uniref:NAC domain-containing protein n=1 Tax=Lithospermum erythrorhizon TaxID=34254 RepID=A0AAV3PAA3_LITER
MASTTLYPGFRFHPTDVELIAYYLKRKVLGRKLCVEAISEINIYKFSPWDLPDKSCIKSKDLEWYFFCPTERKYAKGGRINRSAENGYWKPSGKDRSINYKGRIVGMVKTLIFHQGHPPHGQRTDWVMHEYRMQDQQLADSGVVQDAFVLCKLFQKDGPGPRNSAQYGATFEEEEWDDETFACGETFPFGCSFVATAGATQLLATTSTSELTNISGPDVSSIWPGQDRPSEPKQGVGNSLMEDIDIESLWASFMEEDIPPVQSDGHENLNDNNIDNPASDVAFAENDTHRGLPDLYIWPPLDGGFFSLAEMQPI